MRKLLASMTMDRWIMVFVFSIWITTLVTCGVTISIFLWIVRHAARVVIPSVLIGFLAGNAPAMAEQTTFDQRGVVTMVLQRSVTLNNWDDTAYRVEILVNTNTMIGQVALVYSNATLLSTIPLSQTLISTPQGMAQMLDLSGVVCLPTDLAQSFVRWRIPTHEVTVSAGIGAESTIIMVTCGVIVLVIGGIVVYEIVKVCNRILTNNVGTNQVVAP